MKITNLECSEPIELFPETKIEVERPNPFFNDYGEQSVPLDIPASEHNRRIMGFPDSPGKSEKIKPADVSIQDGEYYSKCRQFVLSATRRGSISTAFYINDGSFYSRIKNVTLADVFSQDIIDFPGTSTEAKVREAVNFCRSLRDNKNEKFAIFPILIDDDSGISEGFNFKIINAFGKEHVFKVPEERTDSNATFKTFAPDMVGEGCDFYNNTTRTEYVDSLPVTISQGYFISPFIRAAYVLKRVFKHFGYSLRDNFFTTKEPFASMVLLNNVIDPIVTGTLKVTDLLPDVSVSDFLAVFRKKFCCEFTADEGTRQVDVVFLRDIMAMKPDTDLTECLTAEPMVNYKSEKDFRRIVLAPKETVPGDAAGSDNLKTMVRDNPTAFLDIKTGAFYKYGFSGNYRVRTKVAEASMPYDLGEDTEEMKVEIPECIPEFRNLIWKGRANNVDFDYDMGPFLYVGQYATRRSKMQFTGDKDQENAEQNPKLMPMLAFSFVSEKRPAGTISAFDPRSFSFIPLFDYALFYNGPQGIFEKFYRDYDTLLRNALQQTKVKLLLSQSQKQNLKPWAKVVVRGVAFFFNKLKFTLGGKDEPVESEMQTTTMTAPVVNAPDIFDTMPMMATPLRWVGEIRVEEVSRAEYDNAGFDKERTFKIIYPPLPTEEWVGKKYAEQTSVTEKMVRHGSFWRHAKYKYTKTTCWLRIFQ